MQKGKKNRLKKKEKRRLVFTHSSESRWGTLSVTQDGQRRRMSIIVSNIGFQEWELGHSLSVRHHLLHGSLQRRVHCHYCVPSHVLTVSLVLFSESLSSGSRHTNGRAFHPKIGHLLPLKYMYIFSHVEFLRECLLKEVGWRNVGWGQGVWIYQDPGSWVPDILKHWVCSYISLNIVYC